MALTTTGTATRQKFTRWDGGITTRSGIMPTTAAACTPPHPALTTPPGIMPTTTTADTDTVPMTGAGISSGHGHSGEIIDMTSPGGRTSAGSTSYAASLQRGMA